MWQKAPIRDTMILAVTHNTVLKIMIITIINNCKYYDDDEENDDDDDYNDHINCT